MPFGNKLEAGEEFVFGPVVSDLQPKSGGRSELNQITASPEAARTVAVTNRRILVATGSRATAIPNDNVLVVHLQQSKTKSGRPVYTLLRAYRTNNQVAQLNIPGLDENGKARLAELFPNAQIQVHTVNTLAWAIGALILLAILAIIFLPALLGN
jgi:hypothetical protein